MCRCVGRSGAAGGGNAEVSAGLVGVAEVSDVTRAARDFLHCFPFSLSLFESTHQMTLCEKLHLFGKICGETMYFIYSVHVEHFMFCHTHMTNAKLRNDDIFSNVKPQ